MSQTGPFRQRPNLHLALTQSTGSPRQPSQSSLARSLNTTPVSTPGSTPLARTNYSPLTSAVPRLPTPFSSGLSLPPRRSPRLKHQRSRWLLLKQLLSNRPLVLLLFLATLVVWLLNGGSKGLEIARLSASDLGREFLLKRRMQDYRFFPATDSKIHASHLLYQLRLV